MTFDLEAQPAPISSAICGLRRIIIVFSFFQTNKMEKNGMENVDEGIIKRVAHGSCWHTPIEVACYMINVLYSFERGSELEYKQSLR